MAPSIWWLGKASFLVAADRRWRQQGPWDVSPLSWRLQTLLGSSTSVSLNQNQIWPKIPIQIIINTQLILQIKTKIPKFLNLKQNFTSSDSGSLIVGGMEAYGDGRTCGRAPLSTHGALTV